MSAGARTTAAALIAVSAGACLGVVLSLTPAASSLYAVTGIQPAVSSTSIAPLIGHSTGLQSLRVAEPSQRAARSIPAVASRSEASQWSVVLSGLSGLCFIVAGFLKFGGQSTEKLAMLASSGKKAASLKNETRPLWYPTAEAPAWLDGTLPGDRGFDPLGLAKPTEFLQFDLDALDQNAPKNKAGAVVGRVVAQPDSVSTDALQPYSEVFGLQRFRECELIHGRWAMLAVLGCLVSEAVTGVAWQNAGLVEVTDGATYFGFQLPFTSSQVVWFEVLAMGAIEIFRNTELNPEKRCYPGGAFDPLGLTSKDEAQTFRLKEAELKHGRLAMLAFLGFAAAALNTGLGASQSFGQWAISTFN